MDKSKQYRGSWTLPKFRITIKWDDIDIAVPFEEVKGLEFEDDIIEYRNGSDTEYFKTKQPGLPKYSEIRVKRGTFKDKAFYKKWAEQVFKKTNNITIQLEDEKGAFTLTWKLKNTYPKTIKGINLEAKDKVITLKSLELTHEGMTMEQGK